MKNNDPIVVIGAGKTGRGFIARLLTDSGRDFILMDKDRELIDRVRQGYSVEYFDGRAACGIKPFDALHTGDPLAGTALARARLVFVAVGLSNLEDVGRGLNGKLTPGTNVFLCENGDSASEHLRRTCTIPGNIGFIDAAVFCTTIENGGADILSESYDILPCAGNAILEPMEPLRFLDRMSNFPSLMTRKLFTYNAAAAIICYMGWLKGYREFSDGANDDEILACLKHFYHEIGRALCKEYGYSEEDQRNFAAASLRKFTDRSIKDTIERNGRNPARKLAPTERMVGPLRLIQKYNGDTGVMERTIAACLKYGQEPGWIEHVGNAGCEKVLEEICGIGRNEELSRKIALEYEAL